MPKPPKEPRTPGLIQGTLETLILRVLASDGPLHGYAVARRIEQSSGERLQIEEGSLYPALRRLESRRAVTAAWGESDTGREARFYTITVAGKSQLKEATLTWASLSSVVSDILGVRREARA